jgi:hypothetical protein
MPGSGGSEVPWWPGLSVSNITYKNVSNDNAAVIARVTYSTATAESGPPSDDGPGIVTVGATLQSTTTQRDVEGRPIIVKQVYGSGDDRTEKRQVAELAFQIPMVTITATRRLSQPPHLQAADYVGTVNKSGSTPWPPDWGEEHTKGRMWLMTRLASSTSDGGDTWDAFYEWQKAPRLHSTNAAGEELQIKVHTLGGTVDQPTLTEAEAVASHGSWDGFAVYIDPETGRVPDPETVADGATLNTPRPTRVKLFKEVDFSTAFAGLFDRLET